MKLTDLCCTDVGKYGWRFHLDYPHTSDDQIYHNLVGCRISEHVAVLAFCSGINPVYFEMAGMTCGGNEPFSDILLSNNFPDGLRVRHIRYADVVPIWLEHAAEQAFLIVIKEMEAQHQVLVNKLLGGV